MKRTGSVNLDAYDLRILGVLQKDATKRFVANYRRGRRSLCACRPTPDQAHGGNRGHHGNRGREPGPRRTVDHLFVEVEVISETADLLDAAKVASRQRRKCSR